MRYKCRIGSFNMKNWGNGSKKDLEKIANIIIGEKLDVVAFQEILSEGNGMKKLLEDEVKYRLYDWDFCWGLPPDRISDISKTQDMIKNDRRGEGYAYIWNKKKFRLAEYSKKRKFEPRIINTMSSDVNADCTLFARTPYYIRLHPCYGGFFDLRLLNIHIYFGSSAHSDIDKRKEEYEILTQKVYPQISERRYGDYRPAYTVAMGDYNLNISSDHMKDVSVEVENEITDSGYDKNAVVNDVATVTGYGKVITKQGQLTTLKKPKDDENVINAYANSYDHFTYSPEHSPFSGVSFRVIRAVELYCGGDFSYYYHNISDHLPILMEIKL